MAADLVIAIFPSRTILTKALDHIMQLDGLDIDHAAIIARARDGEIVVLDDDISADEGGIAGGTLGAAMAALGMVQLGALALPGVGPIIALGAGVLVGGLVGGMTGRFAAHLLDSGFKSDQVEMLADRLQSGHPALLLEVQDGGAIIDRLRTELKNYRAELVEQVSNARV